MRSPASHSSEFAQYISTAPDNWLKSTAIITTNDLANRHIPENQLHTYKHVSEKAWDEDLNRPDPQTITDHGIRFCRERSDGCKRLILWYMVPHAPLRQFINDPRFEESITFHEDSRDNIWHLVRTGEIKLEDVWNGYIDNTRWALDEVNTLRNSVDTEILITADHGNAFDEWGVYGHPEEVHISATLDVPFVKINGSDNQNYEPSAANNINSVDFEDRLAALGYR